MSLDLYVPTEDTGPVHRRLRILFFVVACLFLLLLLRMWYLQVAWKDYYSELSENNRIRVVPLQPRRGFVYDRRGELLATYMPSFNLYLVAEDVPDQRELLDKLSELINLPPEEASRYINSRRAPIPYLPVKIKEGLSLQEVAILEARRFDLPGLRIEAEPQRHYLYGDLAGHIMGHVGEIAANQLGLPEYSDTFPGTVIGKSGVEKVYDRYLRAKSGKKIIEVDALGHEVHLLEKEQPLPEYDVILTLDLNLQKKAESLLGEEAGAIVALDPKSGGILAMVSRPSFDPNQLSRGLSGAEWKTLTSDPRDPLTNRAVQGQYPPGSIFKLVVASAALETAQIEPDFEVDCKGGLYFGGRMYNDWKRGGHGTVNVHSAIVESCDVFFYQLGRLLGISTISDFATRFGLGQPTGIELISEKPGLIPTTEWKRRVKGEPWYPGENLSAAIGQGFVTVTPLQMATLIATVSMEGQRFRPHLLKGTRNRLTGEIENIPVIPPDQMKVRPGTFAILRRALAGVVAEDNGTGRAARSKLTTIGGKTGTAQVIALRPGMKDEDIRKEHQDHAWFVAFAPVEDPKIAVAILVEHGGQGGRAAAPLAKILIEEFIKNEPSAPADQL
jgi:penicillin-binding protein 2